MTWADASLPHMVGFGARSVSRLVGRRHIRGGGRSIREFDALGIPGALLSTAYSADGGAPFIPRFTESSAGGAMTSCSPCPPQALAR